MKLAAQLEQWLNEGREYFGEIRICRDQFRFELHHYLDENTSGLVTYHQPEDAIAIGKRDAPGNYRPLRSAPTLQRGWRLCLSNMDDVVRAVDFFYPAMLGTASAFSENQGAPVNLRDTFNRQSGMYRITGKITNVQADQLVGEICPPSRCLKTITWKIDAEIPVTSVPVAKMDLSQDLLHRDAGFIPLPCEECCNILVAAARETVKKSPA